VLRLEHGMVRVQLLPTVCFCDILPRYGLNCDASNNVIMITLPDNNLVGEFPEVLTELTRLRVLNLALNKLSGALPASIARWSQLEALTLFSNNMSGALPLCFGNFSRLQTLEIFSNKFSGTFPPDTARLGALTTVGQRQRIHLLPCRRVAAARALRVRPQRQRPALPPPRLEHEHVRGGVQWVRRLQGENGCKT
jgi:hypothetical protein